MVYFQRRENQRYFVEVFHEATRLYHNTRAAWGRRVSFFNYNDKARSQLVDLPKQHTGPVIFSATDGDHSSPLQGVLQDRKSTRNYSPEPVRLGEIGALIQHSIMARKLAQPDGQLERRRSYSSAGAIYGIEHYVIGLNIDGYERPFTAYCSPQRQEIIMINNIMDRTAIENILGVQAIHNPAFAVVQTIDLERTTRKYQERGYRFALIEAGLAAQTLCLVGLSLELRSLIWGGHNDQLLDEALSIAGTNETAINTLFFGR